MHSGVEPLDPILLAFALAKYCLNIGQPKRALRALDEVGGSALELRTYWELRAQALHDLERYAEASEAAQQGLRNEPTAIALLTLFASCQAELGNLALAEQALLSALRQAPTLPELLCSYGLLVMRGGQLEKAEQLLRRAASGNPMIASVQRARVLLAYLRGDDTAVAQESRRLLSLNPQDPYGHAMLGQAMIERGAIGAAALHLRTAASLDPSDPMLIAAANEARLASHWLLWPLRPLYRIGRIGSWYLVAGSLLLSIMFKLAWLGISVVLLYLLLVAYSWLAPRLLRRWLQIDL